MRCFRLAFTSLFLLACVLLTLFLQDSAITRAAKSSKPDSNSIQVWTIGSPHTGELPRAVVPPELRRRAESLGYTIEIKAFRANGFAAKFREALLDNNEPEILAFDNFSAISGMKMPTGWLEGIDSDRSMASSLALVHETLNSLKWPGWVMLVRSAVNYEAARALSMRTAECNAQFGRVLDSPAIEPTLRLAQERAELATRAYLDCDRATLSSVSDESRFVQQCFLPQSDTKVESVKACTVSGNDKLAFVSLVGAFSAEAREANAVFATRHAMDLGQQSILAVLRNQSGIWRVLAITHDPVNTVVRRPFTAAEGFLDPLNREQAIGPTLEPVRLLTPNGVFPLPARGERFGDFIWQPSQSADVMGQVAEFTWARDTNFGLTRLFFLPANESKLSTGLIMSGGASAWRVWSISKSGDVAFSEQRSFMNR